MVHGDADHDHAGHVAREIPPAVRRAVLVRDEGKCQVPGCRGHRYIDLHHIHPRAAGGGHDPDNLVVVCSTHHDLLHRDVLRVTRDADGTLTWTRGSGEPLAMLLRVGIDRAELDHDYLSAFAGEAGTWCLLDRDDLERAHVCASRQGYPKGRQSFMLGDMLKPGIGYEGTQLPSR